MIDKEAFRARCRAAQKKRFATPEGKAHQKRMNEIRWGRWKKLPPDLYWQFQKMSACGVPLEQRYKTLGYGPITNHD
jgi:hypothetical protein